MVATRQRASTSAPKRRPRRRAASQAAPIAAPSDPPTLCAITLQPLHELPAEARLRLACSHEFERAALLMHLVYAPPPIPQCPVCRADASAARRRYSRAEWTAAMKEAATARQAARAAEPPELPLFEYSESSDESSDEEEDGGCIRGVRDAVVRHVVSSARWLICPTTSKEYDMASDSTSEDESDEEMDADAFHYAMFYGAPLHTRVGAAAAEAMFSSPTSPPRVVSRM